MRQPLVSIIIPTRNRRAYLAHTLDSVFAQSYEPVEIIVIDDGSTDGTREWLQSLGERVRLLTQDARGVACARNAGVQEARGEYIAFQDDDDLMPSHRIGALMGALRQYPGAIMATGDYALIDDAGALTGRRWMPEQAAGGGEARLIADGRRAILWPEVPAVPHTTLFRTEDGARAGWFDPQFRYACSDADFLARLGALGSVVYLPQVVSYYRRGHGQIWGDNLRATYSQLQLWHKHRGLLAPTDPLRARLDERCYRALNRIAEANPRARADLSVELTSWYEITLGELPLKYRVLHNLVCRARVPMKRVLRTALRKERGEALKQRA